MPPLLTCSKSYSIFYSRRRSRVIFFGSSLTKTNFYRHGRHFLCVSAGCSPTLLPTLILNSAPGPAPRDIYGALFHQSPPLFCSFINCFLYALSSSISNYTSPSFTFYSLSDFLKYAYSWWLWSLLSRLTLIISRHSLSRAIDDLLSELVFLNLSKKVPNGWPPSFLLFSPTSVHMILPSLSVFFQYSSVLILHLQSVFFKPPEYSISSTDLIMSPFCLNHSSLQL